MGAEAISREMLDSTLMRGAEINGTKSVTLHEVMDISHPESTSVSQQLTVSTQQAA
jgi:hypothetical protein